MKVHAVFAMQKRETGLQVFVMFGLEVNYPASSF